MEAIIKRIFIENWQRKIIAIITATIIWFFVNHSIIDSKTITNIPLRIINLPPDKTVVGLLPNGVLSKRVNLALSGTKDVIAELEPEDLEVVLDASSASSDEWIVNITKKNLVSLNPNIDLLSHITSVEHNEFVIKLSHLVTARIPITILPPIGEAPPGYEYLDFWPQKLIQTVNGPEEEIQKLKSKGLDLVFDLNEISKEELDSVERSSGNFHDDEIRYIVPNKWKMVSLPFHNNALEEINDPEAHNLRIYFLQKQTLPLEREIPLSIFFPLHTSDMFNPQNCQIAVGKYVQMKNNIPIFSIPLYVKDVSKLFLSIVRDNLLVTFIAAPQREREFLEWSLEVINPKELEDTYVAYLVTHLSGSKGGANTLPKKRESLIRKRFKDYTQRLRLFVGAEQKLNLESTLEDGKINIISY